MNKKKIKEINKEVMEGTDKHLKNMLWILWFGVPYNVEICFRCRKKFLGSETDRLILEQSGGKDESLRTK